MPVLVWNVITNLLSLNVKTNRVAKKFVDTDATRFTMRLHKVGFSVHKVRSEIYWLEALWKEAQIKTLSPFIHRCFGVFLCSHSTAKRYRQETWTR